MLYKLQTRQSDKRPRHQTVWHMLTQGWTSLQGEFLWQSDDWSQSIRADGLTLVAIFQRMYCAYCDWVNLLVSGVSISHASSHLIDQWLLLPVHYIDMYSQWVTQEWIANLYAVLQEDEPAPVPSKSANTSYNTGVGATSGPSSTRDTISSTKPYGNDSAAKYENEKFYDPSGTANSSTSKYPDQSYTPSGIANSNNEVYRNQPTSNSTHNTFPSGTSSTSATIPSTAAIVGKPAGNTATKSDASTTENRTCAFCAQVCKHRQHQWTRISNTESGSSSKEHRIRGADHQDYWKQRNHIWGASYQSYRN